MATIWGSTEDIGDDYKPSLDAALQQLYAESGIVPRVKSPLGGKRTLAQAIALGSGRASDHYKGRGVDIDNWAAIQRVIGATRFKQIMAAHGWHNIQIDGSPFPDEPWHYANHSSTPAGSGGSGDLITIPPEALESDMRMQILYDVTPTIPDAQKRVLFIPGALWKPITADESIRYAQLIAALDTAQGVTGLTVKTLNCSADSMAKYRATVPATTPVDIDEPAFAAALAPLLAPHLSGVTEAELLAALQANSATIVAAIPRTFNAG